MLDTVEIKEKKKKDNSHCNDNDGDKTVSRPLVIEDRAIEDRNCSSACCQRLATLTWFKRRIRPCSSSTR